MVLKHTLIQVIPVSTSNGVHSALLKETGNLEHRTSRLLLDTTIILDRDVIEDAIITLLNNSTGHRHLSHRSQWLQQMLNGLHG